MYFERFYDEGLAHASFLIGCPGSGEAIVVDPNRDFQTYLDAAARQGMRIAGVTETHIHADFLSGSRELASMCGATLYLSDEGDADWKYAFAHEANVKLLRNGDSFGTGALRLTAVHTPGHTPEHLTFLLADLAAGDVPVCAFTGDFVFVGDVGRPDLLEAAAGIAGTAEPGARRLFQSLQRFRTNPLGLLIWPSHGAGSACGKALGSTPVSSLGYELAANWAFRFAEEGPFVKEVLAGQPDAPPYFGRMKRLNKLGPPLFSARPEMALRTRPVEGAFVLDVRPADAYQKAHLKWSQSIELCRSFTTYAGWIVPADTPISIIANTEADALRARRALSLIGLDQVVSWSGPEAVVAAPESDVETSQLVEPDRFNPISFTLDVRSAAEYEEGHLPGARHIHYGRLAGRLDEIPKGARIQVYCYSGERSAIAASMLRRSGFDEVVDIRGGYEAYQALTAGAAVRT